MSIKEMKRSLSVDSLYSLSSALPSKKEMNVSSQSQLVQLGLYPPSSQQEVKPLETREVYQQMKPVICQVKNSSQEASGFFLNNTGLLATAAHIFMNPKKQLLLDEITNCTVRQNDKIYKAQLFVPPGFVITNVETAFVCKENQNVADGQPRIIYKGPNNVHFRTCWNNYLAKAVKTDLLLFQLVDSVKTSCFELALDDRLLEEGTDVYFGGYPMSLPNPTFHKGSISSRLQDANKVDHFTIDGTVVAGNSGSAVVAQAKGILFLVGIVFSEVADLDPEFIELESGLQQARESRGSIGGMVVGIPINGKVQSLNPYDLVSLSLTMIRRNMSTGIGRAVNATHLLDFFHINTQIIESPAQLIESYDYLPVGGKKKKKPPKQYTLQGQVFYLHADNHGIKHMHHSKQFDPKKKQEFIDNTKKWPATFYPDFAKNYANLLEHTIQAFAAKQITNPTEANNVFITFPQPIGADNGNETSTVELYYGGVIGSHIRPKFLE